MPQNETFKRYLDAGMAFTQMSREKAEEFVNNLVKQGDVRRKEAEDVIETLVDRSRKNSDDLVALIRREVADALRNVGLDDLVKRAGLPGSGAAAGKAKKTSKKTGPSAVPSPGSRLVVPGAPKKATTKKLVVARTAASKKATGKKMTGKKSTPAKSTAAKKSTKKS